MRCWTNDFIKLINIAAAASPVPRNSWPLFVSGRCIRYLELLTTRSPVVGFNIRLLSTFKDTHVREWHYSLIAQRQWLCSRGLINNFSYLSHAKNSWLTLTFISDDRKQAPTALCGDARSSTTRLLRNDAIDRDTSEDKWPLTDHWQVTTDRQRPSTSTALHRPQIASLLNFSYRVPGPSPTASAAMNTKRQAESSGSRWPIL